MSIGGFDIILKIRHHERMHTTLSLDDEVLGFVKRYAESRSLGLGKAVSDDGFPVGCECADCLDVAGS